MATVYGYREWRQFSGSKEVVEIVWDYAVDGGAIGALDLLKVKEDSVLTQFHAVIKTSLVGVSGTVEIGKSGDTAGIMAQTGTASLQTANSPVDSASFGSAYRLVANDVIIQTIATTAMTDGKIKYMFELMKA